jgi:4-hydroxy-3-methylbut-2-enyl diphosphate reductase
MGQWDARHAGEILLVESVEDVARLVVRDPERLSYVTQTTLSVDDTERVVAALRARFPDMAAPRRDDICYATQNRQDAVRELAGEVDLVLVVGSVTSSNSNRLRELAEQCGRPAYLIDGPEDIRPEWLAGVARVGVTAGASAPDSLVRAVIDRLRATGGTVRELPGPAETMVFALPRGLRGISAA